MDAALINGPMAGQTIPITPQATKLRIPGEMTSMFMDSARFRSSQEAAQWSLEQSRKHTYVYRLVGNSSVLPSTAFFEYAGTE